MKIEVFIFLEETEEMKPSEKNKEIKAIKPDIKDYLEREMVGYRWGAMEVKEIKIKP